MFLKINIDRKLSYFKLGEYGYNFIIILLLVFSRHQVVFLLCAP